MRQRPPASTFLAAASTKMCRLHSYRPMAPSSKEAIRGRHRSTVVSRCWNFPLVRKPWHGPLVSRRPAVAIRNCASLDLIRNLENDGCALPKAEQGAAANTRPPRASFRPHFLELEWPPPVSTSTSASVAELGVRRDHTFRG